MTLAALDLPTEADTSAFGGALAAFLISGDLLVLSGPLGAGKTVLARALCHGLGLPSDEAVTSPTFTLVQEYETTPPLSHADVYRLESPDDVRNLDLEAARTQGRVVVCEWGQPFIEVLGGDALVVELTVEPRTVALSSTGPRSAALLQAFWPRASALLAARADAAGG